MSKVKLTAKTLAENQTQEFDLGHAQSILDYQVKNGFNDWELDDKRYILENGVIKLTGATKKSKEQSQDSGSNKPNQEA